MWWNEHELEFGDANRTDVAVIERPGRKQLTIEVSCPGRSAAEDLRRKFGGRVIKLPADWLKQFAKAQRTRPLHIGKRLTIANPGGTSVQRRGVLQLSRRRGHSHIVSPAGAAFGTGQHVTTAMSLRLLEEVTRRWDSGWTMADLGTGSGILALAAKALGAGSVSAIDNDPVAISTAKANARLNRIGGIDFEEADVRRWRLPAETDVVTANLFSELLVTVIPKLRRVPRLIVSGIMRDHEHEVILALKRNSFEVTTIRRRGKWVAMLARQK